MTAQIFQTRDGYEIITSSGNLFTITGKTVKPCGKVGNSWKGSGRLVKGVPNQIKTQFYELQAR
jgi:hypothetical protein